jgi:hypothetical protein
LRDPARVHHARARVAPSPSFAPSSRFWCQKHDFSVFAKTEKTKLSNNARQTTTAAKRLYTWDTPS